MKRTTKELYGVVPDKILKQRKKLANYFIKKAIERIYEIYNTPFNVRDDVLIDDCTKAIVHWERLIDDIT